MSLPKDPYEAAEIDGANSLQQFWYITLPMLRPVSAIAIVIQINELRTYDLPYILTRGGPGNATEVLSLPIAGRFWAVAQRRGRRRADFAVNCAGDDHRLFRLLERRR
jgi:ABC-type sugar transport system permease subunit